MGENMTKGQLKNTKKCFVSRIEKRKKNSEKKKKRKEKRKKKKEKRKKKTSSIIIIREIKAICL